MNHLGGNMYGDGDFVVEFSSFDASWSPMKAHVVGDGIDGVATVEFQWGTGKPSCKLALETVRAVEKALGL